MFIVNTPEYQAVTRSTEGLHPWVQMAFEDQNKWIWNPHIPKILAYEDQELMDIGDTEEGELVAGDIVWMSFTLTYFCGNTCWGPEICPIEFVRLAKARKQDSTIAQPSVYPTITRTPLKVGKLTIPKDGTWQIRYSI